MPEFFTWNAFGRLTRASRRGDMATTTDYYDRSSAYLQRSMG